MSEKKYIDADLLKSELKALPEQERLEYMGVYDCINSIPTADVEEVVHCRDCKWWEKYKGGLQGGCYLHSISLTGSRYCANGVKENG